MPSREQFANAIRVLSMDAVQHVKSGHPGMPMGMAMIAEVLWRDFLQHNPQDPNWWNRDRFVLSNGHGSMLLYALLHLTGYDLSIEDIKQFRQLDSKTPGHPELGYTPGVETTTGPLGQGLSNAVGMAIAEQMLGAQFNRPQFNIIDHFTYVFVGDGCLMEGISHEVCSLAGTLGLGKLIVFWDDNGISIDGPVAGWFSDDTPGRFAAYGWQVIPDIDGHDSDALNDAIVTARSNTQQPTIICCKTTIGFGAPQLAGTAQSHGAPLGDSEIAATRATYNWSHVPFDIPAELYAGWNAVEQGQARQKAWQEQFSAYTHAYPELAQELTRRMQAILPADWDKISTQFIHEQAIAANTIATRKASQQWLNHLCQALPELVGGSADLTSSNLTAWQDMQAFSPTQREGRYLYYGVREFGMSAIMNGLAIYGGIIPYGGTFLTFSDYARNAVRMAALMRQQVIFVYTHDSIGLGEDGPTHQPVEHLASLRIIPNMTVWRPCDAVETAVAWKAAVEHQEGPTCLVLSRQSLPHQQRTQAQCDDIARGGYILVDSEQEAEVIIIATGSEVGLALSACDQLSQQGIAVRVVAMPSTNVFERQPQAYQDSVLPPHIMCRVAVEAGVSQFWRSYVGLVGRVVGIDRFGESAPASDVYAALGLTVDAIVDAVHALLK